MNSEKWGKIYLSEALNKIIGGGTPSRKNSSYWTKNGIPWITVKDLKKDIIDDSEEHITASGLKNSSANLIPSGTVIIATRMAVGKSIRCTRDVAINQDLKALLTNKRMNSVYLHYLISSKHQYLAKLGIGSTVKGIVLSDLRKLKVLLPPLLEQKKIAEILSAWDRAIELTERLIELKEKKKKRGFMQQLLTEKKRFPGFDSEWKKKSFSELYKTINGKHLQVKRNEYLQTGKHPIVDQSKKLISGYSNQEKFFMDVPLIVFGDHTREIKYINFPFTPGADGTILLKTTIKMNILFGYYLLKMKYIPNLGYSRHMRELKECFFNYPLEISEQAIIADMLWSYDKEIKTISLQREFIQRQKKGLMQKLLTGKWRIAV